MVSDKKQLTKVETKREDPTRCQDKKNFKNVKTEKNTPLLSLSQKKVNSDLDYSTGCHLEQGVIELFIHVHLSI